MLHSKSVSSGDNKYSKIHHGRVMSIKNRMKRLYSDSILVEIGSYLAHLYFYSIGKKGNSNQDTMVLLFHDVEKNNFLNIIRYLKRMGFDIVKLQDLIESMSSSIQSPSPRIAITFDDGLESVFNEALPVLKSENVPATIFIITDRIGKQGVYDQVDSKYLDLNQIHEMQSSGLVDIGSHTITHPCLSEISEDTARKEIIESKKLLESSIQAQVQFFSFPYGGAQTFSSKHIDFILEAGYMAAFTNIAGINKKGDSLFEMKRICIGKRHGPYVVESYIFGFPHKIFGAWNVKSSQS